MVRRILIYTREEINRMDPRSLNTIVEENSTVADHIAVEDKSSKHLPTASV